MVSRSSGYVPTVDRRLQLRGGLRLRRRRGLTSPPLTCVEVNPGPYKVGRKVAKTGVKQDKRRRKKLSGEEKGEIKLGVKLNISNRQLARMVRVDPKTIRRWKKRYIETGYGKTEGQRTPP